ncbi:MAG: hypothetical protein HYR85_03050 [Planctomycetes bacterium]|nr:hypothetical protein [Planctomycetota bacterium]MBI3847122.1 hypothetical protein [Planctomycetota bacterium]
MRGSYSLRAFVAAVCLTVPASRAWAGDYHVGNTLVCGDCHSGRERLSRRDANRVCLSCHGNGNGKQSNAPNVVGVNRSVVPRQAGALSGLGSPHRSENGHTLGSALPAPGGSWVAGAGGLTCVDCHDSHGQASQYRNLVLRPGTADANRVVTYVTSASNDRTKDVWIRPSLSLLDRYSSANVRFNQPIVGQSAYSAWCEGCHSGTHESLGSPRPGRVDSGESPRGWRMHPTASATIGAENDRHSSFARFATLQNRVPTLSASGNWPSRDNVVSCMSCHKAHGNDNAFGLLYMSGRGAVTEDGDTGSKGYVDLCHQCHTTGIE